MANVPVAWTGNITAISGDSITLNKSARVMPPSEPRFVWFTDGAAKDEIRRILGVSGNDMTLDAMPVGVANGDTIRVSTTMRELANEIGGGSTGIQNANGQDVQFIIKDNLTMQAGSFLSAFSQSILFKSGNYIAPGSTDAMFQMGYKRQDSAIVGGCQFTMDNPTDNRLNISAGGKSSGYQVKWFGSNISWGNDAFWYLLNGANPDTFSHIEGNTFDIYGGFRIGGSKSILKNNIFYSKQDTGIYPFTTLGTLGELSGNVVLGGRQAFYWAQNTSYGGSTTIFKHGAKDVTYDISIAVANTGVTLTSIDDELRDNLVLTASNIGTGNAIERKVSLSPRAVDLGGNPLEGVKLRSFNSARNEASEMVSDADGSFPNRYVWRQRIFQSNRANYYDNQIRMAKYGYVSIAKTWDSRKPYLTNEFFGIDTAIVSTEAEAQTLLASLTIDKVSKTVDGSGLTPRDIYEALSVWWPDNLDIARFFSSDGGLTLSDGWTASNVEGVYTDSNGTYVTVVGPNMIDGTRIYLYDITNGVTLDNSIVSGGAGYKKQVIYSGDADIRFHATYAMGTTAKLPVKRQGTLTAGGLQFNASQEDDLDYIGIGIDGSTVTEIRANFADVELDLDDADGYFDVKRAYSWYVWICTTLMGAAMYNPEALIKSPDIDNIVVDGPLQLKNVGASRLTITGGIWKRLDGQNLISDSSNTIHWIPTDRTYTAIDIRNEIALALDHARAANMQTKA